MLVGYFVSFFHLLSLALGRKVEVHTDVSPKETGKVTKEKQTEKSSKRSKRYNSTKVKKEKKNKKNKITEEDEEQSYLEDR